MEPAGYVLIGLKKYRDRAHSPVILDYGPTNMWLGVQAKERVFEGQFEQFHVLPVSKQGLKKIKQHRANDHHVPLCVEDFSLWRGPEGKSKATLCTERDFFLSKTFEASSRRCVSAVRSIQARLFNRSPIMEKTLLIAIVVLSSFCEMKAQAYVAPPEQIPAIIYASSFVTDKNAPPVSAVNFAYDAKAPALHASSFAYIAPPTTRVASAKPVQYQR